MTTHQWITDRRPTAKDADKNGAVMILVNDSRGDAGELTAPWQQVGLGTLWQNTMHNQGDLQFPPTARWLIKGGILGRLLSCRLHPRNNGGTMTDQHRATPEDWGLAKSEAEDGSHADSCLLELRARVAALEAAQVNTPPTSPAPLSQTLVARIHRRCGGGEQAVRIAICEVADWLQFISSFHENKDALFQAALLIRKQARLTQSDSQP
jgi:hypothetical protein